MSASQTKRFIQRKSVMMASITPWVLAVSVGISSFLVNDLAAADAPAVSTPSAPWKAQMRGMSEQLMQLINEILNEPNEALSESKERERIARIGQAASSLESLARGLKDAKDLDLGMKPIWAGLVSDISQGTTLWKEGHHAYAKTLFFRSTALCAECHTRTSGPSATGRVLPVDIQDPLLKLNAWVALRDFDSALKEMKEGVRNAAFRQSKPFEWERFVRAGLQVSVRGNDNPQEALELVRSVLQLKDLPVLFRQDVLAWEKDLKAWIKQRETQGDSKSMVESAAWKQIQGLSASLEKSRQFAFDRSVEVGALRLSSELHRFLKQYPQSPRVSQALELQGDAYEVLRPHAIWDISQSYWSACIRTRSHTEGARRCYRKLESSVVSAWTGSSGVNLPRSVVELLGEYRKLAGPRDEKPSKDVMP